MHERTMAALAADAGSRPVLPAGRRAGSAAAEMNIQRQAARPSHSWWAAPPTLVDLSKETQMVGCRGPPHSNP